MEEANFSTLPVLPLLKAKRKQVGRACSNCRKSKTACSETRPCSRCVSHNMPDSCVDAPRKRRTKIVNEGGERNGNLAVTKTRRTKRNKSPGKRGREVMEEEGEKKQKGSKGEEKRGAIGEGKGEKEVKIEGERSKFEEEKEGAATMLFDIPFISDSTHFLQENHSNNMQCTHNNQSFGSTGSLTDILEARVNNPSLESLIVNVVGDIKKKEKEKGFVVISA